MLLTVAALFSFVAGSSLLALALAGLGVLVRPDSALLGLLLLAVSLAQRRRRAAWGAAFFLGIIGIGWSAQFGLQHGRLPILHLGGREWLLLWAVTPGMTFLTWLLLPFCAELGEAPRRARWLPVVLWTLVYFVISCFVRTSAGASEFALLPLWCVLAAGGLSRLLPAITELPVPWARYLLAILAVLSLLAIRLRAEWPQPAPILRQASRPVPAPVRPVTPTTPAALAVGAAAVAAAVHSQVPPAPAPHPTPKTVPAIKPQPKPTPKKPAAAAHKPLAVVRARTVYHGYRYARPRRMYRHYYRRY